MADKDRIHRWITQADLERMLADSYRRGAEAMREAAAKYVENCYEGSPLQMIADDGIRALPIPEDKR